MTTEEEILAELQALAVQLADMEAALTTPIESLVAYMIGGFLGLVVIFGLSRLF